MSRTNSFLMTPLSCLLLFACACSKSGDSLPPGIVAACPSPSPKMASNGRLKLFIPDSPWAEYFSDEGTKRAAKVGLTDLKTVVLARSDLEIRIWALAFNDVGCFVLKRINSQWSALKLPMRNPDGIQHLPEPYPEPASGWNVFWGKLVSEGLLALPDSSCFKDYLAVMDGIAYVVEINVDGKYRIYTYGNPSLRTPEHGTNDPNSIAAAKHMGTIASLIFDKSFFPEDK